MKNGILKQTLKQFAICLPFALSIGIYAGYGSAATRADIAGERMGEIRTAVYAQIEEEVRGEGAEYVLTDAEIEARVNEALAENQKYQELQAEQSKYSKVRLGLSAGGGAAFGVGLGVVYGLNLKDDDEKEL